MTEFDTVEHPSMLELAAVRGEPIPRNHKWATALSALAILAAIIALAVMPGCVVKGERHIDGQIFGMVYSFHDRAIPDPGNGGNKAYEAGFTDWGEQFMEAVFGWLIPDKEPPPPDEKVTVSAKVTTTEATGITPPPPVGPPPREPN